LIFIAVNPAPLLNTFSPLLKGGAFWVRGKLKLVIEIDGESHEGRFSYDMQRQQFLESMGLTVIRFNDADVKGDMNNVLMAIEGWIERNNPFTPFSKGEHNPLPHFSKGELPTHFEKEPINSW
jgi:hypothetical protein